jgi:hypothetical protein
VAAVPFDDGIARCDDLQLFYFDPCLKSLPTCPTDVIAALHASIVMHRKIIWVYILDVRQRDSEINVLDIYLNEPANENIIHTDHPFSR